jgi:hemin uptake protein HemP
MPDETRKSVPRSSAHATPAARPQAPGRTTSQALLGQARELIIEHEGREYHLRLTQQGKLILTA